jgi:hypothetical protein
MADSTYITAIPVQSLFADEAYQRPCDEPRAKRMADAWDPSLVGVLDVSDRGVGTDPRYAVVNGQHRWRAAILVDPTMSLVCNVHQGLDAEAEARLFWDIDRSTKKLTTWDRWKARSGAGDPAVRRIEQLCQGLGTPVAPGGTYVIKSIGALEQMFKIDEYTMTTTIQMVVDVWPNDQAGLEGSILRGLFQVVGWCEDGPSSGRLADALSTIAPAQVRARAVARRDSAGGGVLWAQVTRVIVDLYNGTRGPGPKLVADQVLSNGRPS